MQWAREKSACRSMYVVREFLLGSGIVQGFYTFPAVVMQPTNLEGLPSVALCSMAGKISALDECS